MPSSSMRAAGAVVWRRAPAGGVHVVLVHRPRYDDWSLPKGKVEAGEHPAATAVREVAEETGERIVLGRPLPTQRYEVPQGPKTVHYWAGRALGGTFQASEEVDEIAWLDPAAAAGRLTHGSDREVIAAFASARPDTYPLVVLRHAQALSRSDWNKTDDLRPLSSTGRRQAAALIDLLAAFGPVRVLTSPATRCLQTVQPFAASVGLGLEHVPGLAQGAPNGAAAQGRETVYRAFAQNTPTLVCSHRPVLPALLRRLSGDGEPLAAGEPMRPGELLVIHRRNGLPIATERLAPL
ncbi:MAG: NUDIX hydrolase [Sporichthyaceae bacterium]